MKQIPYFIKIVFRVGFVYIYFKVQQHREKKVGKLVEMGRKKS